MTDLETLVRSALADEAGSAPSASGAELLAAVERRERSGRPALRPALLVAVAVVTLAVVVGLASLVTGHGTSLVPTGSSSAPVPGLHRDTAGATAGIQDGPLVTRGECAGLVVRLAVPDGSSGLHTVRPLVPGAANTWTTDGTGPLYLQAEGPCVERLTYDIVNDGVHRVQGLDGDIAQRFRDGLGVLTPDEPGPGVAHVELALGCTPGTSCAATRDVVGSLTLTVAPTGRAATRQPTRVPVRVTVTVMQNGTVTSSVTDGSVPTGAETVTVRATP